MTFEQEVWDVICAAAIHAEAGAMSSRIADVLTPRVAAAIQKAAVVASSKQADAHGANPVAHVLGYEAALAVLRGESA